jgi:phosphatidate cytidylyltransferase
LSADRVPTPPAARPSTLGIRTASALVMGPAAIAAVWFGPPWFPALVVAAGGVMAWEWARLCGAGRIGADGWLAIAVVTLAALLGALRLWPASLGAAVLGAVLVLVAGRMARHPEAGLAALGPLWFGIPCIALLWVGADPETGWRTIFWIFAVVWATDIGAYACGRTFGGPKLAPRVSPSKTWSGLLGGVLSAGICGYIAAALLAGGGGMVVFLVSAGLAVVAQAGDLAESAAKRKFGVKDSSAIIPGHGGLLDRLDGLIAVAPLVALLNLLGGNSVVTWR